MNDASHSTYVLFGLAILASIVGAWLALKMVSYFKGRSVKRRLNRGLQKEKEAAKWLKRNGYKIIDYQLKLSYTLQENGVDKRVVVSPDFRVSKNGQEQLVEVKSGSAAPRIENRDTRRQLLEYHFIEPDTSLFLLDMENNELKKIEFPLYGIQNNPTAWKFYLGLLMGVSVTAFFFWWFTRK